MEGKVSGVPEQAEGQRVRSIRNVLRVSSNEFMFTISCLVALLFLNLPMDLIDGRPAPTFIFKGQPATFHAFLVCVAVCSCGSRCSIHFHERNPKAARISRRLGSGAMLAAVAIFLWAAAPAGLRWLLSLVS